MLCRREVADNTAGCPESLTCSRWRGWPREKEVSAIRPDRTCAHGHAAGREFSPGEAGIQRERTPASARALVAVREEGRMAFHPQTLAFAAQAPAIQSRQGRMVAASSATVAAQEETGVVVRPPVVMFVRNTGRCLAEPTMSAQSEFRGLSHIFLHKRILRTRLRQGCVCRFTKTGPVPRLPVGKTDAALSRHVVCKAPWNLAPLGDVFRGQTSSPTQAEGARSLAGSSSREQEDAERAQPKTNAWPRCRARRRAHDNSPQSLGP